MRAQLIPLDGGPPLELTKDLTLVGRKEDCDLRLNHKSVSKQHCVIVKTDGLLLVRDLGSTNGTRVNGQRVRRAALLPNDQLSVAGMKFKVHLGAGAPPPVAQDMTVQMEAADVAAFLAAREDDGADDDESEDDAALIRNNQLPDVYPDDARRPR